MPQWRPVLLLSELVEHWIWKWLLKCSKNKIGPNKRDNLKSYINKFLNFNIKQQMLNTILRQHKYKLDISCKILLIDILGDQSTKNIDLTEGGFLYIEEIFQLYHILSRPHFHTINSLGLDCLIKSPSELKYVADVNSIFYQPIRQMNYLQKVTLKGVAESELLQALGASCHHLEYLDVEGSWKVDDESIAQLLLKFPIEVKDISPSNVSQYLPITNKLCSNLSFLGISGTEVSDLGICLALYLLVKLYSFGGFIYSSNADIIVSLYPEKIEAFTLSKLWESNINDGQAAALLEACPKIQFIDTNFQSLLSLQQIYYLSSLVVECDFKDCEYELLNYLSVKGSSLQSLILRDPINSQIDLASLTEFTPNLRIIKAPIYAMDGIAVSQWKHLEEAVVTVHSAEHLKIFSLCVPNLKKLELVFHEKPYMETSSSINDELIVDILQLGGLRCIESLLITECGIGHEGLEAILLSCPKLSSIGKLFYWTNLNETIIKKILTYSHTSNWDLKIIVKELFSDIYS